VVPAGRDSDVDAIAIADDGVHAEPARARLPLARVLVVADARHHLPRIAAVVALEERRGLNAAPEFVLPGTRLQRPDVGKRPAVLLGKRRRGLRLLEGLPEVVRAEDLHAEERVAARGIEAWLGTARVDERGVHGHTLSERPTQRPFAARLGGLRHEESLACSDREDHPLRHGQPPETAGMIVTESPGASGVSSPLRSRMWSSLTNTPMCRRTAPVSSQMLI